MTMIEDATHSQSQQHENWKAARARLNRIPKSQTVENNNIVELVAPTTNPAADVMDMIIAAVGNSLGLPVNEIVAGVSTPQTISARKLAMALCVRRPRFTVDRVAKHFGVQEGTVVDSVELLDPILTTYAITSNTPLALSMPIISREWALTIEQLRKIPRIIEIQKEICRVFDISMSDLVSARRDAEAVSARRAAMALCKKLTSRSLPQIGLRFGGRDHTTVLYSVRRFRPIMDAAVERMTPDASIAEWVVAIHAEMAITPLADSLYAKKRRP